MKYYIYEEIYAERFFQFQEEMAEIPKRILEDIDKGEGKMVRIKNNESCFSKKEMQEGITYRLQDGRFFHFFERDEGFEFSLFDKKGKLQDGGVKLYSFFEVDLERIPKNYILEEMSSMISPTLRLGVIRDENNKRLDNGLYEEDIEQIAISGVENEIL